MFSPCNHLLRVRAIAEYRSENLTAIRAVGFPWTCWQQRSTARTDKFAMFGIHHFTLFLIAGILLNLTPGPDTAFILGRTIAQGRRAGIASAFGIAVGSLVHTTAAAVGLSAFIATTAWAFTALKFIGGAYLIFLGVRMILAKRQIASVSVIPIGPANARGAFRQGVLTNVLNPKVALFFLAFLPQFIDPAAPSKIAAFILLGLAFVTTGTIWCLTLAVFAAKVADKLRGNAAISDFLNRAIGSLFVFLGARLAFTR